MAGGIDVKRPFILIDYFFGAVYNAGDEQISEGGVGRFSKYHEDFCFLYRRISLFFGYFLFL